jgi:hypothetical protein
MTTRAFDEPPGWFQRQPNGSWGPALPEPVLRVPRLAYCACDACLHEARLKACPVRLRPQGRGADVDGYDMYCNEFGWD